MKSIVMLSGPVGAGKTTIARELVSLSPEPVAYIEGDTFWQFIAKGGTGQPRKKNFLMVMRAMTAAAQHYALGGYEVILDFSFPPWYLETASKVAKFKGVPLDYVVIKPSQEICAARAAARTEGTIPDYRSYQEFYELFETDRRHMICDDTSTAAMVARRIRDGLHAGNFRVYSTT